MQRSSFWRCLVSFAWETIAASTTTEAEALLKWNPKCEINLPYAYLSGTLHHLNFTSFPTLTRFNITGNSFNGSIPPAIADLSNLVFLDLSYNRFQGKIPPQIGNLTELQHLDLSLNFISGVIPHQIGNLQKTFQFLWGELVSFPDFILCSGNLTYLDLRGTNSNGSIPESFFTNLEKLEYLDLSDNKFSGFLSPNINNLSNLKNLQLSHNQFQGEIPYSIGQLKDLQVLDISQNLLNSTIPSSLSSLTKLSILELSSNLFSDRFSPDDKYSRQRVLLKKCMFWFVAVIQKSPLRY
nr:probable leucine-rich repeat receptor-like protein kinase At1g35710 [Ipomoea trifida]